MTVLTAASGPVCLIGAGGHGLGIAHQITARLGLRTCFADTRVMDIYGPFTVPYRSIDDIPADMAVLVTIGAAQTRRALCAQVVQAGLQLVSFVADPQNCFADQINAGSVVLAGAVVNGGARLGQGVIVNSGAIVEHGCRLGEFSHVAPGAVIAGDAQIGAECWIGAQACVLQGRSICDGVTVGAAGLVIRDIDCAGVYVGQPVRRIDATAAHETERG